LQNFREVLFGGNADQGKKIFFERVEASCLRCHKINGAGDDVGPELADIGAKQTREYLLESMIQPNAKIAPGFETLVVIMKNGASYAGVFKNETENELVINSPEDGIVKIAKADIKTRDRGSSGMPEGLGDILSKRDLRDLLEYLTTLKSANAKN
jgi:quinoprotein glucose dehydrogenase